MQSIASIFRTGTWDLSNPQVLAVTVILAAAFVAVIALKGIALWKAAHKNDKVWFVALLIVNTMGILEILYIYYFSKRERKSK
ncbi:MAG: DUF5652 family protein [Candidatus Paceibacterota bacterium]|jgi:methionyl-tRNA synthetase